MPQILTLEQFTLRHPAAAQRASELARDEGCLVTAVADPTGVTLYRGAPALQGAVVFVPAARR